MQDGYIFAVQSIFSDWYPATPTAMAFADLTYTYTEFAELARAGLIGAIAPSSLRAGGRNLPAAIDDGHTANFGGVPERACTSTK
ncbi:hypothetical protein XU06_30220 (plasmid) [Rhodococcus erythropolis]|nr:hypothetical protein XU06_30220 [Rhodococcus erythropolis]